MAKKADNNTPLSLSAPEASLSEISSERDLESLQRTQRALGSAVGALPELMTSALADPYNETTLCGLTEFFKTAKQDGLDMHEIEDNVFSQTGISVQEFVESLETAVPLCSSQALRLVELRSAYAAVGLGEAENNTEALLHDITLQLSLNTNPGQLIHTLAGIYRNAPEEFSAAIAKSVHKVFYLSESNSEYRHVIKENFRQNPDDLAVVRELLSREATRGPGRNWTSLLFD